MTAHDNAALANELYRLFNEGRIEEACNLGDPRIRVDVVPFGMTFEAREGFTQFMRGFKDAFPDLTITVVNQVATDDHVVSECSWRGTHRGPLMTPAGPIPATGKPVEGARFCEVWRIEGGKIVSLVNYQDITTWLRQLGLAS